MNGVSTIQVEQYHHDTDDSSDNEATYDRLFRPQVGDKVRILNPKRNQKNKGVVRNFCRDGKVRISIGKGLKLIDRAPSNIVCTNRVPETTNVKNIGKREQGVEYAW